MQQSLCWANASVIGPFLLLFLMWYMHSMLCGHVCACVCLNCSAACYLASSSALSLACPPLIGLLSLWCHGVLDLCKEKAAGSFPLVSSRLRVSMFLFRFILKRVNFLFSICPLWFSTLFDFRRELNLFNSLMSSGVMCFKDIGMFFLEMSWFLDGIAQQLYDKYLNFFLPYEHFLFFLGSISHFEPFLLVALVYMQ